MDVHGIFGVSHAWVVVLVVPVSVVVLDDDVVVDKLVVVMVVEVIEFLAARHGSKCFRFDSRVFHNFFGPFNIFDIFDIDIFHHL